MPVKFDDPFKPWPYPDLGQSEEVDPMLVAHQRSADALEYIAAQVFHIRKAAEQMAEQGKPDMIPVFKLTE